LARVLVTDGRGSDLILRTLGKDDSRVTYKQTEPFTTRVRTPHSSKAKRDLDFRLVMQLEEGMRRTVEWFKNLFRGLVKDVKNLILLTASFECEGYQCTNLM